MKEAKASRSRESNFRQSADPAISGPRHNVTCKGSSDKISVKESDLKQDVLYVKKKKNNNLKNP